LMLRNQIDLVVKAIYGLPKVVAQLTIGETTERQELTPVNYRSRTAHSLVNGSSKKRISGFLDPNSEYEIVVDYDSYSKKDGFSHATEMLDGLVRKCEGISVFHTCETLQDDLEEAKKVLSFAQSLDDRLCSAYIEILESRGQK